MTELTSATFTKAISRRDFLRLCGIGLFGLFQPPIVKAAGLVSPTGGFRDVFPDQQGRVMDETITIYDSPSFDGKSLRYYWRDGVFPITDVVVGGDEPPHNRIWYRVGDEGYAHSGAIQPVRTALNEPMANIPEGGQLAEVTVPYTDSRWEPGRNGLFAYRYYYETTHWVIGLVYAPDGSPWYSLLDDKWEYEFFVPAAHLRLISPEELTPISPDVPANAKRLEVLIPEQVLIAYEWEIPVFMARVATGAKFRDGNYETPLGHHITYHKRPSRHMAAGNLANNGYDLPGVPWICYITESGISLHGTYWHNNFGRPRSHGCINLSPQAAKWVFRWTLPHVPPEEQMVYKRDGTAIDIIE